MDTEKFEKFLLNRQHFLKDMLLIAEDPTYLSYLRNQLDEVNDIIHHFNVLVKGEISPGLVVEE